MSALVELYVRAVKALLAVVRAATVVREGSA